MIRLIQSELAQKLLQYDGYFLQALVIFNIGLDQFAAGEALMTLLSRHGKMTVLPGQLLVGRGGEAADGHDIDLILILTHIVIKGYINLQLRQLQGYLLPIPTPLLHPHQILRTPKIFGVLLLLLLAKVIVCAA